MQIKAILSQLEQWAPPSLQEKYDNARLIVGDKDLEATGALVSLDCTEEVVDEAIARGCNVVIAHHPILFGKRSSITGKDYVERALLKAIKNDVALYACHTNLDNVNTGVNAKLCEVLGILNPKTLAPKQGLMRKVVVFVPSDNLIAVREAMFSAGAGEIGNYTACSFSSTGQGTFMAGEGATPFVGEIGALHTEEEARLEVIVEEWKLGKVLRALQEAHPYEVVAYDVYTLEAGHPEVGAGMVGELEKPMDLMAFLSVLKQELGSGCVRHTARVSEQVKRIAVCGGSGSFLLENAVASGADVFVTGDYKYHEFFDADGRIVIADVGHFESEQFTSALIKDFIVQKFPNFAVHLSHFNTNPVKYF